MLYQQDDKGLKLRTAAAQASCSSIVSILSSVNGKKALELINEKGPSTGKTALHRALEGLVKYCTTELSVIDMMCSDMELSPEQILMVNYYLAVHLLLNFKPDLNTPDKTWKTANSLLNTLPNATKSTFDNVPEPIRAVIDSMYMTAIVHHDFHNQLKFIVLNF